MITLPPFKAFLASNIPSVYDNTLSYYDELVKLIAYLEQQVVPAVNKNTADIEAYAGGLEELKKYVDNYFDNLDVQEEINNKLDEMAESGELASIIAQFLEMAPVFAFNTISEMSSAENLINGCTARVLGNTSASAGDGAYYSVRTRIESDVPDGYSIVAIGDNLVGVRIQDAAINELNDNPINVKFFGAKGDGITDDRTIIQDLFNNNPKKTFYFPSGDYLIRGGLKVAHNKPICITLEPDARLFTDTATTTLLDLATDRDPSDPFHLSTDNYQTIIKGGVFDCDNCTYGVKTQSSGARLVIDGSRFENVDYFGIYVEKDAYYNSSDSCIKNVNINGKGSGSANNSTAIYLDGLDNRIINVIICATKIGVDCQSSGNFFDKVHGIASFGPNNVFTTPQFNSTICFRVNGSDNFFNNCYADTYGTGWDVKSWGQLTMTGCFTYWWQAPADAETYCINFNDVYSPVCSISNCDFKTAPHGTAHIMYKSQGDANYMKVSDNYYSKTNVPDTDLAFNVSLNNLRSVYPFETPATQLSTNSYYFLGYVERGGFDVTSFDLNIGGGLRYNINLLYTSDGIRFSNTAYYYTSNYNITLVLADAVSVGSKTFAKLFLKTTDIAIYSQVSIDNTTGNCLYVAPLHSKSASPTPSTIILESSEIG